MEWSVSWRRTRVLAAIMLAWAATACGDGRPNAAPCLPGPLKLDRLTAAPGDPLLLAADPAPCSGGNLAATYRVVLFTQGRQSPVPLGQARAGADGGFTLRLTVPEVTPGEATITVLGSALDRACQDTNGKCASYAVPMTITPRPR
jgi:hypothetical protein